MNSNNIVDGNQYFTKVRNVASADIQRLNADEIFVNKLRVAMHHNDPATSAGVSGDTVFCFDGSNVNISVCAETGDQGVASWQNIQLS